MSECKRKPNSTCVICHTPVYRRPGIISNNADRVYCTRTCYGKSCRKENACVICGTGILASANKKTCSRACANKNRAGIQYTGRRMKDNVVSQKRLKVRLIALHGSCCERCEFRIEQVLQVHHKNRDRDDNRMQNLELLCPNCHASEHYLKN